VQFKGVGRSGVFVVDRAGFGCGEAWAGASCRAELDFFGIGASSGTLGDQECKIAAAMK
jgi:hypothetical protein